MNDALAVVTPSYAPDAHLFTDLHRSVLAHTSADTVHHVIVPPQDRPLFARHEGPRCRIWTVPELLPRHVRRLPAEGWWLNLRRPWPPVRGWVLQQAVKIAMAGLLDAPTMLVVDSDVVLVRPVDAATFRSDGEPTLHRRPSAVHSGMARHVRWHQVARELLGIEGPLGPPLHDYVSPLASWSTQQVRALQDRLSRVSHRPWLDAFTSQLHVSEFILYGVFLDEIVFAGRRPPPAAPELCHAYWDHVPLDASTVGEFVSRLPPSAVGMMISARSATTPAIRHEAIARCAEFTGAAEQSEEGR